MAAWHIIFQKKAICGGGFRFFGKSKPTPMKRNAALSLLIFPSLFFAQNEAYLPILNDPDVIWAAEILPNFFIEPDFYCVRGGAMDSVLNTSVPLKLINQDRPDATLDGVLFGDKLLDLCMNGRVLAYEYAGKNRVPLDAEARANKLTRIDSAIIFNPETYEETILLVRNSPDPDNFMRIRLRQLLFYRASTDEFELYTAAFAPLVATMDNNGNFRYDFLPFWFEMPPYSKKENAQSPSLSDPNITWARRLKTEKNSPRIDSAVTLKNYRPPVMAELLDRFHSDRKYAVLDASFEPIPFEKRAEWGMKLDTLITYDPETYEEKIVARSIFIGPENLTHLKLMEDWFWDEKQKTLIVRLNSFAPVRPVTDNNGRVRSSATFFWRQKK